MPLLVSPLLAAALSLAAHRLIGAKAHGGDCACLVVTEPGVQPDPGGTLLQRAAMPSVVITSRAACERLDAPINASVSRILDRLHVLSAMSICFARGVNDTPKLVAVFLSAHLLGVRLSVTLTAAVMAFGGLVFARKVAETMSRRVTRLDHREGLTANIVTSLLVLFASKLGLPVSTTHVAVGAIAGVGASAQSLNARALRDVLLSWVATLPLAAVAAFAVTRLL